MGFVQRLHSIEPTETWQTIFSAASERYDDGVHLAGATPPRLTGAVYLFGYAAEILLKAAYFEFTQVPPGDDLFVAGHFSAVKKHQDYGSPNLHEVDRWANLLIQERVRQGNPLNPLTATLLRYHVGQVSQNWKETLRYRSTRANQAEYDEVKAAVDWLRGQYQQLRS